MLALAGVLAFRGLPPTAMGDLTLTVAWATFLRLVCAGGVPLILRRDYRQGSSESRTLFRDGTAIVLRLWAAALVAGVGIAWRFGGREVAVVFLLVALHHVFATLLDCYRAIQVAQGLVKRAAVIDLGSGFLLFACTAVAFLISRSTLLAFGLAYAVSGRLSVAFAAVAVSNLHRPAWTLSAGASVLALGSLPFFIEALIVNGYFRLSANVVYVFDSPAQSGVFGTAQSLALLLGVIPIAIGAASVPRIVAAAEHSVTELRVEVDRLWRATLPAGAIVTVLASGSSPFWLPILLGPKGRDVVPHFILFALSRFAVFVSIPAMFALDAMKLQRRRVAVAIAAAIATFSIGLPLTRKFGGLGMTGTLSVLEFGVATAYVGFLPRALRDWHPPADQANPLRGK